MDSTLRENPVSWREGRGWGGRGVAVAYFPPFISDFFLMGTQEVQYMDGVQARLASHYKTPLNGCTQAGWMKGQQLESRHSLFPSPVFPAAWCVAMCGLCRCFCCVDSWRTRWGKYLERLTPSSPPSPSLPLSLPYPPPLFILRLLSLTRLQQVGICNCIGGGKYHVTMPSGIFDAEEHARKQTPSSASLK